MGDAQRQKELLERALAIKEAHYGPDHVQTALTICHLGLAYGALGEGETKVLLLRRALTIFQLHGHPHAAMCQRLLDG